MLHTEHKENDIGQWVCKDPVSAMSTLQRVEIYDLFAMASRIRNKHRGKKVDLCSIISAKSGACPEDCSFCAQSAHSKTVAEIYPLLKTEKILEAALSSRENGSKRFCLVTSGMNPSDTELDQICDIISEISLLGLMPCATLGLLDSSQLKRLKKAGLNRYHHNLETSEAFFSEICTTHTYHEKVRTIADAKQAGLSVCSGGIFGLGESWEDRIDMAFAIKEMGVDSVPINFLSPVPGTPLEDMRLLTPIEALKIIAIYRLILPDLEIRVCGGRPSTLRGLSSQVFLAGADGLLIGNYLTTAGGDPSDDIQMIRDMGLEI
jgi:biotin synthase